MVKNSLQITLLPTTVEFRVNFEGYHQPPQNAVTSVISNAQQTIAIVYLIESYIKLYKTIRTQFRYHTA
jgi:hypothetical protein